MDYSLKERFLERWANYFPGAELPLAFYYTEHPQEAEPPRKLDCLIAQLADARQGRSLCFNKDSVVCPGGKRYLGFTQEIMPKFEYFLSCGIPGTLEGERYKKTPEIVKQVMKNAPPFSAPASYAVFKRWDRLEPGDEPEIVVFFASPDVLSGLFTLAGYEESELEAVVTPFGAGCATIVQYPYLESRRERPRAVLGLFDVSARPWVPREILTFAVPMGKFVQMVENMDESFLVTPSWDRVKNRM